jgi:hypothetical protein
VAGGAVSLSETYIYAAMRVVNLSATKERKKVSKDHILWI